MSDENWFDNLSAEEEQAFFEQQVEDYVEPTLEEKKSSWIWISQAITGKHVGADGSLTNYPRETERITEIAKVKSKLVAIVEAVLEEAYDRDGDANQFYESEPGNISGIMESYALNSMCEALTHFANLNGDGDDRANESARAAAYFGIKLGMAYQSFLLTPSQLKTRSRAKSEKNLRNDSADESHAKYVRRFKEYAAKQKESEAKRQVAKDFELADTRAVRRAINKAIKKRNGEISGTDADRVAKVAEEFHIPKTSVTRALNSR